MKQLKYFRNSNFYFDVHLIQGYQREILSMNTGDMFFNLDTVK